MLRVLLGATMMLALLTATTCGQTLLQDDNDADPVSAQERLQRALLRYGNVAEQNATLLENWRGQLHERLERLGRLAETWRNSRVEAIDPPRDRPTPPEMLAGELLSAPLPDVSTAPDQKPDTPPSLADATLAERCEALADELRQLARQLRAR